MLKVSPHQMFWDSHEKYVEMGGVVDEIQPMFNDFADKYSADGQYIGMGRWAFDKIIDSGEREHFDVGGEIGFLVYLARFTKINHVDIRDSGTRCPNFNFIRGSITNLPFADNSIKSLSCLHVAEHIGLGRYGDEVDPDGFAKGCRELVRVLAPGGKLYFAVPMGIPRTVFNAHRVIGSGQLVSALRGLSLLEFSGITTGGVVYKNIPTDHLDAERYACGMGVWTK